VARAGGQPRLYCRRSCRQRAFEARRRAQRAGLEPGQVVVGPDELQDLTDRLYVLACALDDVDAGDWDETERFAHLYDAATPLRGIWRSRRSGPATW
jgi:hypothetical protein